MREIRSSGSVEGVMSDHGPYSDRRPCGRIPAKHVLPSHCLHVGDNFRISIIQLFPCNVAVAGVIGRGDQTQISVEFPHQRRDVAGACGNVLFHIKGLESAESFGSRRHELHQPHRPLIRNCTRIPSRFDVDQRADELRRHSIVRRILTDEASCRTRVSLSKAEAAT
jgi:hypothetical protein